MNTKILSAALALLSVVAFPPIHSAEPDKDLEKGEKGEKGSDPLKEPDPWANGQRPKYPFKVSDASDDGEVAIKKFKLDRDMKCELFAAEPLVANIVSFSIDEKGRFFVAETFRVGEGVIDNRQHMDWLDEDLNSRTVEDRAAFQKRHLGDKVIKELGWASERIKLVEDRAGKGKADYASVFADGFDTILDGVGAGILARKGSVYFANIPNFWLLKDEKGAGYATMRKSLHYGYGVRNAFMGHDLHGIRLGPDNRVYFSIGDRAAHVKTSDGRLIDNPDSGAVFRCNPDGSNLELYCTGLRNPQCLSFDRYGNLFTGDNNADSGDKARWEYLVEGGDYGWRIGWQYIRSPALGSFNTEKMWHEQEPGQPEYILPPVGLITAGPSGNVYYPGTGMPDRYNEHFFLCDFTGGVTAKVHSFRVQPKGASFELLDRAVLIEGCLCTDVQWGVNGGLYVSDWVEGWTKTGKGRIYRVFEEKSSKAPVVAEVRKLLADGFDQRPTDELIKLLGHKDMRVRQEAHLALAEKAEADTAPVDALKTLLASDDTTQPARIHAMWALEIIARKRPQAIEAVIPMLDSSDGALRGIAAKMLGERRCEKATGGIVKLLQDKSARVRFHAAVALGKIGRRDTIPALLDMLRDAKDADPFLRHAGVMALVWINDFDAISAAGKDPSAAVRMAALLAMRRLERNEISMFVNDNDPNVVLEAARAINDVPISGAMGELAALIDKPSYNDALLKRVLNANYRVGNEETASALLRFAMADGANASARADALNMLGDWVKPPLRDRITNLFRPIQGPRDQAHAANVLRPVINDLLKSAIERPLPESVRTAAVQAMDKLNLFEALPMFIDVVNDGGMPAAMRIAALKAMETRRDPRLLEAVRNAVNSGDTTLRREAMGLYGKLAPDEAAPRLAEYLDSQQLSNKRFAVSTLNEWPGREAEKLIGAYMDSLLDGRLEKELMLDVLEATAKRAKEVIKPEDPRKADAIAAINLSRLITFGLKPPQPYVRPDFKGKLERFEDRRQWASSVEKYKECLYGGNGENGRKIFLEKAEASCVRCHKIGNKGSDVGPNLQDVGLRQKREYILESIVDPNKVIAQGFESAMVKTNDGQRFTGVVKKDDDKVLILADGNGIVSIKKEDIQIRKTGQSPMPQDISKQLSKGELRDLVEFLANQKTPVEKPREEDSKHQ